MTTKYVDINLGQSHCVGLGDIATSDQNFMGIQRAYKIWVPATSSFEYLEAGINNQGNTSLYFGPEMALARTYQGIDGATQRYLIKYGVGGTSLHTDWAAPSGATLVAAKAVIDAAIASLAADGSTVVIGAFNWMQGESDSASATNANAYSTNLDALIDYLYTTYAAYINSSTRFVIGQITNLRTGDVFRQRVMYTQKYLGMTDARCRWFSTTDPRYFALWNAPVPGGDNHLDGPSTINLGIRFAECGAYHKTVPEYKVRQASNYAGAVIAHDADDILTIPSPTTDTVSGAIQVTTFNNVADATKNATQSTAISCPLWAPGQIGGRDVVSFNGTTRFFTYGNVLDSTFSGSGKQFSFMGVISHDLGSTTGGIMSKYDTGSNQRAWALQINSGKLQFTWQPNAGGAQTRAITAAKVMPTLTPYWFCLTYDGTQSGNNGQDRVRIYYGTTATGLVQDSTTMTAGGVLFDIPTSTTELRLGCLFASGAVTQLFKGFIGEIIVAPSLLTDTQMANHFALSQDKWSI